MYSLARCRIDSIDNDVNTLKIGDIVYIKESRLSYTRFCYIGKWKVEALVGTDCVQVIHESGANCIFNVDYFTYSPNYNLVSMHDKQWPALDNSKTSEEMPTHDILDNKCNNFVTTLLEFRRYNRSNSWKQYTQFVKLCIAYVYKKFVVRKWMIMKH